MIARVLVFIGTSLLAAVVAADLPDAFGDRDAAPAVVEDTDAGALLAAAGELLASTEHLVTVTRACVEVMDPDAGANSAAPAQSFADALTLCSDYLPAQRRQHQARVAFERTETRGAPWPAAVRARVNPIIERQLVTVLEGVPSEQRLQDLVADTQS